MRFIRAVAGLAPGLLFLGGCQEPTAAPNQSTTTSAQTTPIQTPVERGKYLVTVGGCNDCHTPKKLGPNGPEPDMTQELSGNPATEKVTPVPAKLIAPGKWLTVANNHLGAWAGPWGVSFAMRLWLRIRRV